MIPQPWIGNGEFHSFFGSEEKKSYAFTFYDINISICCADKVLITLASVEVLEGVWVDGWEEDVVLVTFLAFLIEIFFSDLLLWISDNYLLFTCWGLAGLQQKTPPQGYVCHRCKVPGMWYKFILIYLLIG